MQQRTISRTCTIAAAVGIALLMALIVMVPGARAAVIDQFQAENASNANDTSAFQIITDSSASPAGASNNAVKHLDGSRLTESETTEGTLESVTVYAKASNTNVMRLFVDGAQYGGDKNVAGSEMFGYVYNGPDLPAGTHKIEIRKVSGSGLKTDLVELNGSGVVQPPADADGDGVPDSEDNCDTQPGPASNGGCPVSTPVDTDGDGVNDDVDQCDTQPGPASNNGCPEPAPTNTWTWPSSANVEVRPGDDIDAKINGAAAGSTIKVYSDSDDEYTYNASQRLELKSGTKVYAEPGEFALVGGVGAKDVDPTVTINAAFTADEAMQLLQGNNTLWGFELTGLNTQDPGSQNCAGKGMFLAGGDTPNHNVQYNLFKDNPSLGAANIRGIVHNNEFDHNGTATWAQGCNGGGFKSRFEIDFAFNYLHDHTRGNGAWTDNGSENDPNLANDSWIRNNVSIRNGAAGIRIEETPDINPTSDPFQIATTVENNVAAGNSTITGRADIHIHDSANVMVRNNHVGPQTVEGAGAVPLGGNNNGIRASDSCRSDRPDLGDPTYGPVEIRNNIGHGNTRLLVEESRYKANDVIVSGNTGLPLSFEGTASGCN